MVRSKKKDLKQLCLTIYHLCNGYVHLSLLSIYFDKYFSGIGFSLVSEVQ